MLRGCFGALAAACLLLLTACSGFTPSPDLEARAHATYTLFRASDREAISNIAGPQLLEDLTPMVLARMQAMIPRSDPASRRLVGYHQTHAAPEGSATHALTYEYGWPDRVALVNVVFAQSSADARLVLTGFYLRLATRVELKANDFALLGKPLGHYLMLLAVFATVALMIVAIVMSIRTPGLDRRWLWCLASLAAFAQIGLDWTTGLYKFVLLHGALIGVVIARDDTLFASWVVKTSIPVGAVIVIFRLWRRRKEARDNAARDIPPS